MSKQYHFPALLSLALTAALGGFLFGYDTAVVNGAIGYLKTHFHLNADLEGFATSVMLIGCMAGAALAGPLGDRFGRKWTLVLCGVLFAVSSLAAAIPHSLSQFLWARFAGGAAIGAASMLSPLYIAEIAPEKFRGALVATYQLAIVVGILVVFFANREIAMLGERMADKMWNVDLGWRWMFASLVFPSALFSFLMLLVPESPRWLAKAGRLDQARAVLERICVPSIAAREIQQIEQALHEEEGRWAELLSPGYSRALLIGVLLAVFSQLSGINAVTYYGTDIFKSAGAATADAFTQTVIVGIVNLLFTFLAIGLVDRAGRRPMLIFGTLVQAISLACIGLMFHLGIHGILLLAGILVFVGAFSLAMGPISWIVLSEIFPTKLRGRAMSVAVVMLWLGDFVVTQTFPRLRDQVGPAKTFWTYAFFSLLSAVFVVAMLPETKGRTLEEIEASWRK